MKRIHSLVHYDVPSWNFCNDDRLDGGKLTKHKCRFCVKSGSNYRCLLYDAALTSDGTYVNKVRDCCKAAAGFQSVIEPQPIAPAIPPKKLMEHAIDSYTKYLKDLMAQGYPEALARQYAKDFALK